MKQIVELILQYANTYQYQFHPQAVKALIEYLELFNINNVEKMEILNDLFTCLAETNAGSRFVNAQHVQEVIRQINIRQNSEVNDEQLLKVRVIPFERRPKCYISVDTGEIEWNKDYKLMNRLMSLQQRYLFARKRCLSSGLYRWMPRLEVYDDCVESLLPITSLEGQQNQGLLSIIGTLVARKDKVCLEDLHGFIELNMEHWRKEDMRHNNFFLMFYLIVIVRGIWDGTVLHVKEIVLPPAEAREHILFNDIEEKNYWQLSTNEIERAKLLVKNFANGVIVFLANIFIDCSSTIKQLADLFRKVEEREKDELANMTFVLIGNFSSTPLRFDDAIHLQSSPQVKEEFVSLLERLAECIKINAPITASVSHFIIVPGPEDLSVLQGIFPQPSFPAKYQEILKPYLRNVQYAYNPCHLQIGVQEIVICRRNFERSFQQSELSFHKHIFSNKQEKQCEFTDVTETTCIYSFQKIAKTILDEAHLMPEVCNGLIWSQDEMIRLTVLPNLLLLCDLTEQWECSYRGVHVINPGSFTVSSTFLWYTPADNECVLSSLHENIVY